MRLTLPALALLAAVSTFGAAAQAQQAAAPAAPARPPLVPLLIETPAFADGGIVPMKYSARGDNVQPAFTISNAPANVASYTIIFHDVDVGLNNSPDDVLHWMAWNIPGNTTQIAEGKLPEGSVQGKNIRGANAYLGPGAPPGPRYHHYVLELYALSSKLDLPETATRAEVIEAMKGKVLAKAGYVGRFKAEAPPAPAPAR
jgi:Raf kinase inhibitor-like YbhB/YbcL family protein